MHEEETSNQKLLERVVESVDVDDLMERVHERIDAGYLYGDL